MAAINTRFVRRAGISLLLLALALATAACHSNLSISKLQITPNPVAQGQYFQVVVEMKNGVGVTRTETVTLNINNVEEQHQSITVNNDDTAVITFTASRGNPGPYSVEVKSSGGAISNSQFTVVATPGAPVGASPLPAIPPIVVIKPPANNTPLYSIPSATTPKPPTATSTRTTTPSSATSTSTATGPVVPVLQYLFEEGSGTTVANTGSWATTRGGNGKFVGSPQFSSDVPASTGSKFSLSLSGAGDYVLIPDDFDYTSDGSATGNPVNQLTIELWLKMSTQYSGGLWADPSSGLTCLTVGGGEMDYLITTTGGSTGVSGGLTTDGQWHHYAFVYNGNLKNTYTLKTYIDGRDTGNVGFITGAISKTVQTVPGRSQIAIGSQYPENNTNTFKGLIDDIRIYTVALAPNQFANGFFKP